jgi:hypothetical protein
MNSFTAVSEINQGRRVVARFGRADRDRAFRAAVRHSRHVRILRVAVPLTTVVVFLSGVAFTVLMKPLRVLSGTCATETGCVAGHVGLEVRRETGKE